MSIHIDGGWWVNLPQILKKMSVCPYYVSSLWLVEVKFSTSDVCSKIEANLQISSSMGLIYKFQAM